ncbi:hypothetical protein Lal_00001386 [Lupinus albus]|nr:hypothetical protein Lal_00001386 [Lupinus albus]
MLSLSYKKLEIEGNTRVVPECKDVDFFAQESTHYLFSSYTLTYSVWQLIYKWLGFSVALPLDPIQHFSNHLGLVKDKKCCKIWSVIWFATIWAI